MSERAVESLILKDFRCFAGLQRTPLRPVTLLVGENSTGKTSFLAAARIAEQLRLSPAPPDFNEEPFNLGAYDELANYRSGKPGRAESFLIGSVWPDKIPGEPHSGLVENQIEFVKHNGLPFLQEFSLSLNDYRVTATNNHDQIKVTVATPSKPRGFVQIEGSPATQDFWFRARAWFRFIMVQRTGSGEFTTRDENHLELLYNLLPSIDLPTRRARPHAFAPIRAQPQRTYEVLSDAPRPQGEHIPVLLAQMYGRDDWEEIREPLEEFARTSGLFDEISIKQLGKSDSSPFQIHVKLGGPPRNLIDVGYGVSQVLPLLVDLLRDKRQRMYLFQQPEVHLHPRAQAELGTLLASIAKSHSKQLLIETHSDYIIDRIRMDVRDKRAGLRAEDVIILYFERDKGGVTIYPIELDGRGNMRNVPPSYRGFFLDEESRFLWVS
jgi:hypothetical protein